MSCVTLGQAMSVSFEYLQRCAAETGFQTGILEKVVRLGELAGDIARHPRLGEALALNGGAPLNVAFGQPHRLSADLDYNYVAHVDRDAMLADRPLIEEAVTVLAERGGYRVQRSAEAFAGRKLHLHYGSVLGMGGVIQIDVNYLYRLALDGVERRTLWQPGELDQPLVPVVSLPELLAGKLLALLDRGSPRDAWHVAGLSGAAAETLPTPRFRQRFIALAATLDRPLPTYTRARLEGRLADRLVAEQLTPMLAIDGPPAMRERSPSTLGTLSRASSRSPQTRPSTPRRSNRATSGSSSSSPISRPRLRDWPSTRRCSGSSPTYGASPEARALVFEANG